MSMYRKEWDCCGSVTETFAWEPDKCPFCTPPARTVAYAVASARGGIHKLAITQASAERKAAKWREEWPDNGCRVRPLVFGDTWESA